MGLFIQVVTGGYLGWGERRGDKDSWGGWLPVGEMG